MLMELKLNIYISFLALQIPIALSLSQALDNMSSAQWNATVPGFSSLDKSNLASITPGALAVLLRSQNGGCRRENSGGWSSNVGNNEFSPAVDVFDTPTSYAVHVSLPGARREDIGVNYDEVITHDKNSV